MSLFFNKLRSSKNEDDIIKTMNLSSYDIIIPSIMDTMNLLQASVDDFRPINELAKFEILSLPVTTEEEHHLLNKSPKQHKFR